LSLDQKAYVVNGAPWKHRGDMLIVVAMMVLLIFWRWSLIKI